MEKIKRHIKFWKKLREKTSKANSMSLCSIFLLKEKRMDALKCRWEILFLMIPVQVSSIARLDLAKKITRCVFRKGSFIQMILLFQLTKMENLPKNVLPMKTFT